MKIDSGTEYGDIDIDQSDTGDVNICLYQGDDEDSLDVIILTSAAAIALAKVLTEMSEWAVSHEKV